jgi:hypothetical protein
MITAFGIAIAATGASAQTFVSANVTTNTTWCGAANPGPIILQNPIFVTNGATLTILAGCVVRGQPRQQAPQVGVTAGTPGALIVTQDGRIVANGQANAPIIFTTAATDNNGDNIPDDADVNGFFDTFQAGETFFDESPLALPTAPLDKAGRGTDQLWGSLVVLGRAPTNLADRCLGDDDGDPNTPLPTLGWGQCTIEGLTFPGFPAANAAYGGVLPHDSSGIIRYVSLRHGGDEFGLANELNGISLGGVGDGTILENVEVYVNFDDGFEWFGGTVNGKNLIVVFVGDDMFDADEGYTGTNQFLFGVMPFFNENVDADPNTAGHQPSPFGFGSGDKAAEFDGENFRPDNVAQNDNLTTRIRVDGGTINPNPWPMSGPEFYNMTAIGSTPDPGQFFTPISPAATNIGLQFRNGFAGNVHNSIVVNTGAETGIELQTSTSSSPAGFAAIDNANAGLINLVCSTLDDGIALAAGEQTVVNNGNALAVLLGGTAPGSNNAVNPAGGANFLVNEDATFDPTGNANGKLVAALKPTPINPRPASVGFPPPPIGNCPQPTGTGLDPSAVFRGAFPTAGGLWACPWSVLCRGGLMQ